MPTTPRTKTTRRASTSRQDDRNVRNPASNTRPQSLYEPASVQDRIRQWQAQGAASAPAPDALSVRSIPISDDGGDTPASRTPPLWEQVPKPGPSWRQRFLEKERELRSEEKATRDIVTPKKRVISDGHWKATQEERTRTSNQATSKSEVSTPHHDLSYTSTQHADLSGDSRPASRRPRTTQPQKLSHSPTTAAAAVYDLNNYIDQELARHLEGSDYADNSSDRASAPGSIHEDHGTIVSTSKYAETLGRNPAMPVAKSRPKSARILSRTKDIFDKPDDAPPSNRIPSIEAWLEEQPDPFVEPHGDEHTSLVDVPEPLRRRSRRPKRRSSTGTGTDPNKIWGSVTVHEDAGTSRVQDVDQSHSPGRENPYPEEPLRRQRRRGSPDASPTGLKRRGARTQRKPQLPEHRSTTAQQGGNARLPLRPGRFNEEKTPRTCPPTGSHRLETIASVETFKENHSPPTYEEVTPTEPCGLKRKLTTHEDLMSVLSLPMHRRSTRSRRREGKTSSQSAVEVIRNLPAEEEKYKRELRTLVDGVIPVLLQCVLSKSESVSAAGLFASDNAAGEEAAFTKPIIDMGIALERLKSLHGRIPLQDVDSLLIWAQTAQRAYSDYVSAWRLGFHDVIVNLTPLDESQDKVDSGMSRDADGDVVDGEGKKVDVAYLLKRPLVRLKNLNKTFTSIEEQLRKPLAQEVAQTYNDLTAAARRRHQEEQARLEDEAAAKLDCTRVRSIRNLGTITDVNLDKAKKVRARDYFNLTLYHSTGQRLDCRVELIFRDNASAQSPGGDVLICEVDDSGKWLLFAPVNLASISARRGEDGFDLVIMIRGPSGITQQWQELLAMTSDDSAATTEWLSMLGSQPLPPRLNRTRSFKEARHADEHALLGTEKALPPAPDVNEMDIPIGEPSITGRSKRNSANIKPEKALFERFIPRLNLGGGLQSKPTRAWQFKEKPSPKTSNVSVLSSDRSTVSDLSLKEPPKIPQTSSAPATHGRSRSHPREQDYSTPPADFMMSGGLSPLDSPASSVHSAPNPEHVQPYTQGDSPSSTATAKGIRDGHETTTEKNSRSSGRPPNRRALSSTPSQDLPTIAKLRSETTQTKVLSNTPLNDSMRDQWNALSGSGNLEGRRRRQTRAAKSQIFTEDIPSPPALTLNRGPPPTSALLKPQHPGSESSPATPPAPPPHRDLSSMTRERSPPTSAEPQLKPSPQTKSGRKRRSSSPLKREYAPSTASESSSESASDEMSDSSSETSQDFMSEVQDMHTPLVAVTVGNKRASITTQKQQTAAAPTNGARTLAPSDSASQGPYRRVPSASTIPGTEKSRTIAMICTWSDRGSWEQIYPDECSIVISPGLIEAFEMSAAHSGEQQSARDCASEGDSRTSSVTQQPLVAFELTPIVPLRRGTALDINIRSPPTPNSQLKTTSNIMFRSRNPDECDTLYGMINWARCNNPTYIQLQSARPKQPPVTFNVGHADSHRPRSGSWFGFSGSQKQSSYRATSAPGGISVAGDSDASVGTMNTAISALKRLGVSSAFNLNRSSVIRKSGLSRTSGSLYSSSSGTRAGSGSSTPIASQLGFIPGKDGPNAPATSADAVEGAGMINNMKIRLYVRKGQHWDNMGSGRLSILPAPTTMLKLEDGQSGGSEPGTGQSTPTRQASATAGQPGSRGPRLSSSNYTPHRIHGNGREKRIVIRKNKDNGVVLLDAVLGESCFERVMQTGVAVKVWQEDDEIGDTGGVVMGRERVYMMQFPGTREAGWVFGLCGSYRYGVD